jgi:hypothetical protein
MFLVAFGSAYGVLRVLGLGEHEGLWMMIAGPLLVLFDLGYRNLEHAAIFRGVLGGAFLFIPLWLWGLFWTALGAYYHFHG